MGDSAIRLTIVEGSDVGRELAVDRELIAGRAASADIVLADARVSSRHLSLRPSGDGVEVNDLGSTNGTFINEQRISAPQVLHAGDQLRVGGTVFSLVAAPAAAAGPPAAPVPPAPVQPVAPASAQPAPIQPVTPVPPAGPSPAAPQWPAPAPSADQASPAPTGIGWPPRKGDPVPPAGQNGPPAAPESPPAPGPFTPQAPAAPQTPVPPQGPTAPPAGGGPSDWRLTVRTGPNAGRRVEIVNGATVLIGRDVGTGLSLDDPRVSSRHAQVRNAGGSLTVEDLDSANGTLIGGKPLKGRSKPLKEGTEVQVGESVLIVGRGVSGQSQFGPTPTIVGGAIPLEESSGRRLLPIALAAAALVVAAAVLVIVLTSQSKKALTTAQIIKRESPSMVEVLSSQNGHLDSLGSGFTINAKRGLIMTNNHVATGGTLSVQPQGKRSISGAATIVGALPCQDMALIQVDSSAVRSVLTSSTLSKVVPSPGDNVVAMGYPTSAGSGGAFGTESLSATSGIVSKSHTRYDSPDSGEALLPSVVQHTAAINHGNSGGPLLNGKAEVVGMDTATFDDNTGEQTQGENYAISSTQILKELKSLEAGDKASWVGLSFEGSVTNSAGTEAVALSIDGVTPGTPAAKDGVAAGDILAKVNGTATPTLQAYCKAMPSTPGSKASLEIGVPESGGQYFGSTIQVTVGKG
jgi:S1-C subfamily serine protease/pSer/pThr/pTyr-binding forkhead associated (FHA) protein